MWDHEHALEGFSFFLVIFCMMWMGDSFESALILFGWALLIIIIGKVITEAYRRFFPKKKEVQNESP